YRYSEAYDRIYSFAWNDFADWYIESSKTQLNISVLSYCFNNILKLVHPFAPFISEAIWKNLNWQKDKFIATSSWPKFKTTELITDEDFESIINLTTEIRFIRATLGAEAKLGIESNNPLVNQQSEILINLAKISTVKEGSGGQGLKLQSVNGVWLNLSDKEISNFISSLKKQRQKLSDTISNLEARLNNKSYLEKAPTDLVSETKRDLSAHKFSFEELNKQLDSFSV
ncbi:MAG TPA: class I tRNA ligase family protein, partial [Candidatus Dormibacteraeota bacterium]|nr:class I tRNA ligase family protein [Candidatus Dormibacteraeota bacterium]